MQTDLEDEPDEHGYSIGLKQFNIPWKLNILS